MVLSKHFFFSVVWWRSRSRVWASFLRRRESLSRVRNHLSNFPLSTQRQEDFQSILDSFSFRCILKRTFELSLGEEKRLKIAHNQLTQHGNSSLVFLLLSSAPWRCEASLDELHATCRTKRDREREKRTIHASLFVRVWAERTDTVLCWVNSRKWPEHHHKASLFVWIELTK